MFRKLLLSSKGACYGAFISIAPVLLIYHRQIQTIAHTLSWPIKVFFFLCFFGGIMTIHLYKFNFFALLYLFCYTAAAALCQKLSITVIEPLAFIGIPLILSALIMQFYAFAKAEPINKQKLIHTSWLVFTVGLPLVFTVWLPLIAIPGIYIVLKWIKEYKQTEKH